VQSTLKAGTDKHAGQGSAGRLTLQLAADPPADIIGCGRDMSLDRQPGRGVARLYGIDDSLTEIVKYAEEVVAIHAWTIAQVGQA
jgi:hypothetical protein